MKISILGSTKEKYILPKEEAVLFSGKAAGICYMPDTLDVLFNEDKERTLKRANRTLISGHHSVYDHPTYNLALEEIPKILAMILNNEGMYTTSEKSARYTKMQLEDKEKDLYEKWINIYSKEITKEYPNINEKQVLKLAQENARYLISIFTPTTTMEYTVSLRQINYIMNWFDDFINEAEETNFNKGLKQVLREFNQQLEILRVDSLDSSVKKRTLSLFDTRKSRQEEFGENYCTTYKGTFAEFAQAQRHRTIDYKITIPDDNEFYIPLILRYNHELVEEWIKDISSLSEKYPQGLLVNINERGTVENFILKTKERLCGCAQLEIMLQTKDILDKYLKETKKSNKEVYEYLKEYESGVRCKYKEWKCTSPCIWGPNKALTRKI